MKTSQTHPLIINPVQVPGGGVIGMTFCPGKRQPNALTGPWDRDLGLDLAAVQATGAAALVTLMEAHELETVKVADIGERTEALGMEWHFLPIVDVNVPDALFETRWTYAGHRLRGLLRHGNTIVLHCRGGLGRTGMIAARLLVELGMPPHDAVNAVRTARPGTIETDAQKRHVLATKAVSEQEDALADRVLGCLLGGAVGDAFGYAVEFTSLSGIHATFGPAGITEPVYNGGRLVVSDDTQMTLFTAEGLCRALAPGRTDGRADVDGIVADIRLAYLDWLATQGRGGGTHTAVGSLFRHKVLHHPRAPGNTCLSALHAGGRGTTAKPINNSKGCGGVMRTAPLGLLPALDAETALNLGNRASALTHGHVDGWLCGGAMAMMVRLLLDGGDLMTAAEKTWIAANAVAPDSGTVMLMRRALDLAKAGETGHVARKTLGEGWVGDEALAIGLYAALTGRGFPEVLALAANHDGDSDSTASIAGQVYGAWNGVGDLPQAWTRRLDVLDPVLAVAADILATARRD